MSILCVVFFFPLTLLLMLTFRDIRSGLFWGLSGPFTLHLFIAVNLLSSPLCCADNMCLLNQKGILCYWFQEYPILFLEHSQTMQERQCNCQVSCHLIWWISGNHHMSNALEICTHTHLIHQTPQYTSCDITTAHRMCTHIQNKCLRGDTYILIDWLA